MEESSGWLSCCCLDGKVIWDDQILNLVGVRLVFGRRLSRLCKPTNILPLQRVWRRVSDYF